MRYQRVSWLHDSREFPVVLFSEVDDDCWDVRKVDEYADGHCDLASATIETGNTTLGEARIPPLSGINEDPQFEGAEITEEEFEVAWGKAKAWFDLP